MKNWIFEDYFTRRLPGDQNLDNTIRQVYDACYSWVNPTPVKHPKLIAFSKEVAENFNLSDIDCHSDVFVNVFSGNKRLQGMKPYAMCYGGHQFGRWAGQLGDGRAINLGEAKGNDGQLWTFQLKGSGITPYARSADGLAVVRSSIREFLCSEAMFHLGIPTTRALSIILTGEEVRRDMFYDGNPQMEPGAIVCRVARSFLRIGNFEIHSARHEIGNLKKLVDFTIQMEFPVLETPSKEDYLLWFKGVCQKTVDMIVHWMRVGFVHGVMNTDNMSILGLTIDYGPYGWVEDYDLNWTPNTTDASSRRYCFGNQPDIAMWNLTQLAQAIYPLINDSNKVEEILEYTSQYYQEKWQLMMVQKLGFETWDNQCHRSLINELTEILQLLETDMTFFYRNLAKMNLRFPSNITEEDLIKPLEESYYIPTQMTLQKRKRICDWIRAYQKCIRKHTISETYRCKKMNQVNPKYVLRNYLAQLAIDKVEEGDFSMVHELLDVLRNPYDEQPDQKKYYQKRPDWARNRPGCSMLSCSS